MRKTESTSHEHTRVIVLFAIIAACYLLAAHLEFINNSFIH